MVTIIKMKWYSLDLASDSSYDTVTLIVMLLDNDWLKASVTGTELSCLLMKYFDELNLTVTNSVKTTYV